MDSMTKKPWRNDWSFPEKYSIMGKNPKGVSG
jgi:hypothetical protein